MQPAVRTLVFAKAPRAGLAKTRLIPRLGAQGAATLARRMLDHMLTNALQAGIGPVELCTAPVVTDAAWQGIALPQQITCSAQGEGDLGARLSRHAHRVIEAGEPLLLVGTDCIELDAQALREAARALHAHDAFMHPARDGGYVLLGLRRYDARLFSDIQWSTHSVARTTIERIQELRWSLLCGAVLHDIDEPADLQYVPPHWYEP